MRILHIAPRYHPSIGGAETHVKELSERLVRRGHDVTVFTILQRGSVNGKEEEKLEEHEIINGVKIKRFESCHGLRKSLRIIGKVPGSYRSFRYLLGLDKLRLLYEEPLHPRLLFDTLRFGADVTTIVNWASSLSNQICAAKRVKDFPLAAIPLFHTEEAWSRSNLFPVMLDRCDAVIALTVHEQEFVRNLTRRQKSVHVIGSAVDPEFFSRKDGASIRSRFGLGNAPVVGYIGRIAPNKGVIDLIKAMRLVWKWDREIRLVLAGHRLPRESGEDREIAAAIDTLDPTDKTRIVFTGNFDEAEKPSIIDAFDIFAMPSVGESFGIVYLEAWMCRKPVVGSYIGSTQCVIRNGVDGLLVHPGDVEGLARAIIVLLQDPAMRNRMGQEGYAKVSSQYTWNVIIDKVEELYSDLVEDSRKVQLRRHAVHTLVGR